MASEGGEKSNPQNQWESDIATAPSLTAAFPILNLPQFTFHFLTVV